MTGLQIFATAFTAHALGSVLLVRLCEADDLNPLHHARAVYHRLALTVAALLLILGGTTNVR
ncbi:hypothetical protein [Streptomyces sp. NBC_00829]|uniref:hypothetical protein n=1 Tax=Streptomyces sp. NBC_00829 TaxID=2903679 RepID=UPI00386E530B|nr:hypothetical protein OG293_23370 [Streptomyces sp. NBC_00829]